MSRGPGRVERAICGLLESNPAGAFVVNDFAKVCFPGINRIEKKHRVSILRAANKVCNKLWWASESIGGQYGNCVFYNLLNLHSYAVGRVASHESGDWSAERNRCEVLDPSESERMLLGTDIQTRWRSARDESRLVRTDGPYPLAVEMWRARRGVTARGLKPCKPHFIMRFTSPSLSQKKSSEISIRTFSATAWLFRSPPSTTGPLARCAAPLAQPRNISRSFAEPTTE
ncbi:hypothetical protein ABIF86_003216 [Bradyrhizobium japonicum]